MVSLLLVLLVCLSGVIGEESKHEVDLGIQRLKDLGLNFVSCPSAKGFRLLSRTILEASCRRFDAGLLSSDDSIDDPLRHRWG